MPFELSRERWSKGQEVISQVLNSEAERTAVVFLGEANKALEPFLIKKVIHVSFAMGVLSLSGGLLRCTPQECSGIVKDPSLLLPEDGVPTSFLL